MSHLILWSCVNNPVLPVRTNACYQLASWARSHGIDVKVIEFCHLLTTDELVAITEKYLDDCVAIGVSSTFWEKDAHLSEPAWVQNARLRLKHHKVSWLLGGAKADAPQCKYEWVRFRGYSEDDLLAWMCDREPAAQFDIKTLSKRYSRNDFIKPSEVLAMELARGCMFKCRFCSYPLVGKKKGTYTRDFNLVREEFIRNYNEWGTTKYYITDDTVNDDEDKIEALADIAQKLPFKLEWSGYTRLDLIATRPGASQMLKDSGLVTTYFGIESFGEKAAKVVGKPWNSKHAKDYLLKLKQEWKDINWQLSFIVGLPGDTEDSLNETVQWCIDNKMYDWCIFSLFISTYKNKFWKSEFDVNHKAYGYRFPDPSRPLFWVNEDNWTSEKAQKVATELTEKSRQHVQVASFLMSEVSSLGYSYKELFNKKRIELNWGDLQKQTNKFVREYARQSLKG